MYTSLKKYSLFIHLFMQLHGEITQGAEREGCCVAGSESKDTDDNI